MMRLAIALQVVLVSWLLPSAVCARSVEVARFAVVIGNNAPESTTAGRLRYADDDALATQALLREAGVETRLLARFDEGTRGLHPEARADALPRFDELTRDLELFASKMSVLARQGVHSELLLFYAGHGDVDRGEGYVVLEDRRLTRSMLSELLKSSPAVRNHVFIDACKSYYLVYDRGPGGRRAPYAMFDTGRVPAGLESTGFILSTSSDRDSHEWERYQGGVLSHELRSALRGAADVDLDGVISYAELGAFLATANRGIQNPRFRPDFTVKAPGDDLTRPVLSWKVERAALQIDASTVGHIYVESARGERVLDAHPAAGQVVRLWTPAERPLFVRSGDENAETIVRAQGLAQVNSLTAIPEVTRRGALTLAFEALFATPFGAQSVRDFARDAALAGLDSSAAHPAPTRRRGVEVVAGAIAIAGVTAGLTLNGVALGNAVAGSASQVEMRERNERIRDFNRASLPCYGAAAVATITWLWAISGRGAPPILVTAGPSDAGWGAGWTMNLGGRF